MRVPNAPLTSAPTWRIQSADDLDPRANDLSGETYGRLTALRPTTARRQTSIVWLCICECGALKIVASGSLRSRNTKSCGCLHGGSRPSRDLGGGAPRSVDYGGDTCMKEDCDRPYAARGLCRPCYQKEHLEDTTYRDRSLRASYGISEEDYNRILSKQGGVCAICGSDDPAGTGDHFAVDHDHETDEVRGLLCNRCNVGIGMLDDDAGRLRSAVSYLETTRV